MDFKELALAALNSVPSNKLVIDADHQEANAKTTTVAESITFATQEPSSLESTANLDSENSELVPALENAKHKRVRQPPERNHRERNLLLERNHQERNLQERREEHNAKVTHII